MIEKAAYTMSWYVPQRVLLIVYRDMPVDSAMLQELSVDLKYFHDEGFAPIHIISDNTHQGKMQLSLPDLRKALVVMREPKWGLTYLIGMENAIKYFASVIGYSFKLPIRFVDSIDDAYTALRKDDATLIKTGRLNP